MKEQFHNLITNTTSLVGYIAVLMFVGAYFGGDKSYALDPALLKGSVMENNRGAVASPETQSVTITIGGKQYQAIITGSIANEGDAFTY